MTEIIGRPINMSNKVTMLKKKKASSFEKTERFLD